MPRRGHPQASTAFAVAFLAVLHVSSTAHGASPIHVIKLKAAPARSAAQVCSVLSRSAVRRGRGTGGGRPGMTQRMTHDSVAGGRFRRAGAAAHRRDGAP